MEAQGGRGVQVPVHVVHEVKAPEEGHQVVQAVPMPERVIEEHGREHDLDRGRPRHEVKESHSVLGSPAHERQEDRSLDQRDEDEGDRAGGGVAQDA